MGTRARMSALAGAVANDVRGAWAATIEEEHPVVNSTERRAAPRRIAVALNDSDEARHALDWTIDHVLKEEDSLVLIYSVLSHHDHHEDHQHGEKKPSCDSAQISKGWQTLQPYQQQCKSAGIMCMAVVTKGEDGLAFMEAAVGHDCELAVVGSRSLGALRRVVVSSFSHHVLQHPALPVLVVRAAPRHAEHDPHHVPVPRSPSSAPRDAAAAVGRLGVAGAVGEAAAAAAVGTGRVGSGDRRRRRIGVGVDGSGGADAAFDWALCNVYRPGDVVILIHCQPMQFNPGAGYGAGSTFAALEAKAKHAGDKILTRYTKRGGRYGVKMVPILTRGDPSRELVDVAEAHHCDMMVVGTQGCLHDMSAKVGPAAVSSVSSVLRWIAGSRPHDDPPPPAAPGPHPHTPPAGAAGVAGAGARLGATAYAVAHGIHAPVFVVAHRQSNDAENDDDDDDGPCPDAGPGPRGPASRGPPA